MNNNKKVMFINYLNNSSTCNDNHLILLIKTGNAHEEKCGHKLLLIFLKIVRGGIKTQEKIMLEAKWLLLSQ